MESGDTLRYIYIYQNELDKGYIQHDMAYDDCKDLSRRTASDKVLRNKAFEIASKPDYYGCQPRLTSMAYTFAVGAIDNKTISKQSVPN